MDMFYKLGVVVKVKNQDQLDKLIEAFENCGHDLVRVVDTARLFDDAAIAEIQSLFVEDCTMDD